MVQHVLERELALDVQRTDFGDEGRPLCPPASGPACAKNKNTCPRRTARWAARSSTRAQMNFVALMLQLGVVLQIQERGGIGGTCPPRNRAGQISDHVQNVKILDVLGADGPQRLVRTGSAESQRTNRLPGDLWRDCCWAYFRSAVGVRVAPRRPTARGAPNDPTCPLSLIRESFAQGDLVSSSLTSALVQSSGWLSVQKSFAAKALEGSAASPSGKPRPIRVALRLVIVPITI